jgi:hypothetical protein
MSQSKLFSKLIQSLEDPEFDEFAKLYCIEVEGLDKIINCNGPYDSGLDMRAINVDEMEAQYQITTRAKKFETKLREDLQKAKDNCSNYNLPNKVTYFYSYELTSNKILSYRKIAKDEYGVFLNLLEAKSLSEISEQYQELGKTLLKLSKIDEYKSDDDYFDNIKVKSFYDLMSFGTSNDIKHSIIKSYVLNHLNENGSIEISKLLENLNNHFDSVLQQDYFNGFINKLSSERKIKKIEHNSITLTPYEKERLENVLKTFKNEEALLKKQLFQILNKYGLESFLDKIIIKLSEIYECNYSINLGEFTKRNSSNQDLRKATEKFNSFLKDNLASSNDSEELVKELFQISDNNQLLARIASGSVYSKVSSPDKLQNYITQNNNNKEIFLDTNVLIYLIFVHYEPNANFNSFHFNVSKQILAFAEDNNLFLKTTKNYALEAANIFKEALAIVPFSKLSIFDGLGGSTNIIHRFFIHLKDEDLLEDRISSFEDFLKEFKFQRKKHDAEYNYISQISYLLASLEISIETPERYNISDSKSIILDDLKNNEKRKSNFAINNDAIMLMRLGDSDVEINPLDPIFCTWDLSMVRIRKEYFKSNPNCTKWMMYTPSRLMDHFSMMNLEVKNGTLSNEVLSILEEDHSFQSKTQSLLDTMLTIINPENEIGLKYTNKLVEIRENEIVQVNETNDKSTEMAVDSNNGVDIVFKDLFSHYAYNSADGIFESFKDLFTKEELFDDILDVLQKQIKIISDSGSTDSNLVIEMDEILYKSNQNKE